eukprot:TRINITY_DN5726_c0_g1_i1.p1 TRINITY_DN5726_c0_g1~~TRINITY_DN5726_c0_g1_i1.p1  ORF type:complete len:108 (+),score=24.74 TRINITY_DN5726_c0_g1_i1:504-827(+)
MSLQTKLSSDVKLSNTALSASGSMSYSDFSFGLSGELDLIEQKSKNYDVGLQFKTCFDDKPNIFSFGTCNKFTEFLAGYHVMPTKDLECGVKVKVTEESKEEKSKKL